MVWKSEWEKGIDEGYKRICEKVLPEIDIQIKAHEEENNIPALNSLYYIKELLEWYKESDKKGCG